MVLRKRIKALAGGMVGAAVAMLAAMGVFTVATVPETKPNIVVVLTDDETYADQEVMVKTNDLIGSHGTTYSNFFTVHGLCCPSRATFMSGQYEHNHGVLGNKGEEGGYTSFDHTNSLPVWLHAAGYYTGYIGKYMNGLGTEAGTTWQTRPPGWDNWQALIKSYRMYRWTMNDNGNFVDGSATANLYQTDELARRAEAFINDRPPSTQPFFLVVAPTAPHKEVNTPDYDWTIRPAPRHDGYFTGSTFQPMTKPNYNEANVSDKPPFIRNNLPLIDDTLQSEIATRWRDRRESLLAVDDMVERIVTALTNIGQIDNTVIIFWSDNGYFFGEHRIPDDKNEIYEESNHVPLLIRGPGIPVAVDSQLRANIDLAPTIVALAGATAGRVMDGLDLRGTITRPAILINARGNNYANAIKTVSGWVYARFDAGQEELYDLNNDPWELQSQHANPAFAAIKSQLAGLLANLMTCAGVSCQ